MKSAIENLKLAGVNVSDVLIPKENIDLTKWAVVACDQYTSERSYWQRVTEFVKDSPSTLHLIFPEVYLDDEGGPERIKEINRSMEQYLKANIFHEFKESLVLIERTTVNGASRWGLLVTLDLEEYDYHKSSKTPIRATEGTILSRIPPRQEIRREAKLELPHILVLIDDIKKSVIEPLIPLKAKLPKIYDFTLMENGGQLRGYLVQEEPLLEQIATALQAIKRSLDPSNPLMFAMGDGNHSLATAKACWQELKANLREDELEHHPARWAMVELENIYDSGLIFEPIHRVLFNCERTLFLKELKEHCTSYALETAESIAEMDRIISDQSGLQRFGYVDRDGLKIIALSDAEGSIPAGTLQNVIDALLERDSTVQVDYIHGEEVTYNLGLKEGNIGLFLPSIDKHTLFATIVKDGALPRKTFSMGEAQEKRFYMEARKIKID
ncbi:MAG: DUF1015 domain-containing protein [Sphaerochaetaceae bacterium]